MFSGFDERQAASSTSSSEQQPTAQSVSTPEQSVNVSLEGKIGQVTPVDNSAQGVQEAETAATAVETTPESVPEIPHTLRERAIWTLLHYLINHYNEIKHVYMDGDETKAEAEKNEKFAMRACFTQLGWHGKEYNELRSYFYDRLEENTAFRTEEDHARWATKWQPKYFEKHPEMLAVVSSLEKTAKKEIEESAVEETVATAVAAETVITTQEPSEELSEESSEKPSEAVQEAIEQPEAVETATESVSETEISSRHGCRI